MRLSDCLRIFTGFGGRWGGGLRIASGFLPDLVEEAYGLFTDFYRIWGRRLADCVRMFTGFGGRRLMDFYRNCMEEEAYGLCTDVYRIWGRRLTDCLRILTECKGGGLQIVYGFLPDLGEQAYGLLTDFDRM